MPDLPELSVLVPTYGRSQTILRLLADLDRQTLAPERFEVIVVDDGSPEPIELDPAAHRFRLTLLRQANAGPGAARNRAAAAASAPLCLILNDDAVPAPELLEGHLAAHADAPPRTAVLGTFQFTAEARRSPFVQVLAASSLLFDFPNLRHGQAHGWTFFWTCNLSLPTAALREQRFDERFREAIVEDVELGYRLARQGWSVLHREDLVAEHDHVVTPDGYLARQTRLGVNLARMSRIHSDPTVLWLPAGTTLGPRVFEAMQAHVESFHPALVKLRANLAALEAQYAGRSVPPGLRVQVEKSLGALGLVQIYRGVLMELEGYDPFPALEHGAPQGELVSLIVVTRDARAKAEACLAALRATAEPEHPTELIVVDNGSQDGTREWLAAQPDVHLIANDDNAGAPRARNQALNVARGRWIVFLDDDVVVTPHWLARLLRHAAVDGRSGCVGPVADRAAHNQQIPYDGGDDPVRLAEFAQARYRARPFAGVRRNMLASFCLLVRREVIEQIGGFDERFSPWGFEDDDFTVRAALAGFRNRLAQDVFVRHVDYGGAKRRRHEELLARNWSRFAQKWAGDASLPHGDYASIEGAIAGVHSREALYVPLACPAAALPARVVPMETPA
jgi:GT2 family glycosyltransferase